MDHCRKKSAPVSLSTHLTSSGHPILNADEQFKHLRPSKELLYYRRKMINVAKEMEDLMSAVEQCKEACNHEHQLEQELQKRHSEIYQLQGTVSDLQVYLYQEREQVLKMNAENDRLKIRALQDRKKINYLLSLTATSEKELNLICAKPWKDFVPGKRTVRVGSGSTKISAQRKKIGTDRDTEGSDRVNVQELLLQNKALKSQLEEQTQLFRENFLTLLKDRELQREEASAHIERCREDIASLASRLNDTKQRLCSALEETLQMQERHHKSLMAWSTERDLITRETTKNMAQGSSSPENRIRGSGSTTQTEGKQGLSTQIRLLQEEVLQRDQVIKMYQEQCLLQEQQTASLQQQLEASKAHSWERCRKLQQVVAALRGRCAQLDERRRLEGEGFRSDVRLLRQRLTEVERSMLRIARSNGCSSVAVQSVDAELLSSAADTLCKAELLGRELLSIKKKVSDMEGRLTANGADRDV